MCRSCITGRFLPAFSSLPHFVFYGCRDKLITSCPRPPPKCCQNPAFIGMALAPLLLRTVRAVEPQRKKQMDARLSRCDFFVDTCFFTIPGIIFAKIVVSWLSPLVPKQGKNKNKMHPSACVHVQGLELYLSNCYVHVRMQYAYFLFERWSAAIGWPSTCHPSTNPDFLATARHVFAFQYSRYTVNH